MNGQIVVCENCGKRIHISESKSFRDVTKDQGLRYFCSAECAIAKLFGIIGSMTQDFSFTENCR